MADNNTFDTIIIGAGIGGLTTGNLLAKNGQSVLILEKHFQVGGYVTTYKRKKYPMDVVHVIGGLKNDTPLDRIFKYLNLYSKVQFNKIEKTFIYKLPGYDISCYTDIEKYRTELKDNFSEEAKNIDRILDEMTKIWEQILVSYYSPSILKLAPYPIKFAKLVKYQHWTFEKFLNQFTADHKLKKVLSAGWGYNGLNMSRVSALYMIAMLMSYQTGGAWYPRRGYQNLSNAFAENFKEFGGTIKTSTEVERIIIKDKTAVGAVTTKGEEFFADNIISNSDTKNTFLTLIEKDFVPDKIR